MLVQRLVFQVSTLHHRIHLRDYGVTGGQLYKGHLATLSSGYRSQYFRLALKWNHLFQPVPDLCQCMSLAQTSLSSGDVGIFIILIFQH